MRIINAMALAIGTSLVFPHLVAAQTLKPRPHTFTADVGSVRINSRLIAAGKTPGDKVSVKASAILFDPPLHIEDVRRARSHPLPEVNAVVRYWRANIDGSAQEILSFWSPAERPEKSKLLGQPEIFKANRDYAVKNPGLSIVGMAFQEGTTSVLLQRGGGVVGVTLVRGDSRFYLTDHPANDLDLAIIEASYITK